VRRRLFTTAAALSLLLLLTTATLWVWSYSEPSWPIRPAAAATSGVSTHRELILSRGSLVVSTLERHAPTPPLNPGYVYGIENGGWRAMGLRWEDHRVTLQRLRDGKTVAPLNRTRIFSLWLGLPLLASAVLPTWWLVRHRKLRRESRKGTCHICGYDLRASQDRCPECGTPIPPPPS
jgi:hypothetical protein